MGPGRHWEGGRPAQFSVTAEGIDVGRLEGFLGPSLPVWDTQGRHVTGQTLDGQS